MRFNKVDFEFNVKVHNAQILSIWVSAGILITIQDIFRTTYTCNNVNIKHYQNLRQDKTTRSMSYLFAKVTDSNESVSERNP